MQTIVIYCVVHCRPTIAIA